MRKWLPPIAAVIVVVLWLEPFTGGIGTRPPLIPQTQPATQPTKPVRRPPPPVTRPVVFATRPVTRPVIWPTSRPRTAPRGPRVAVPRPATTQAATRPADLPATLPTTFPSSEFTWTTLRGREGFWRLGETHDGVWWFISPDNRVEFLNTVTTVQPYQLARDPNGTIFLSRDYDGTPNSPGNLHLWADRTWARIIATGFKGLGAWCHPVFHQFPVPVTRDLNIWASVPVESSRLYDPGWAIAAEAIVQGAVTPLKDSTHLIGYFLDNELGFSDDRVGPGIYFDNLPNDNPNRQQVLALIHRLWPTIDLFNSAWGLSLSDYQALEKMAALPRDPPETYSTLQAAWLGVLMRDYLKTTTQLVRKYDPNHLILGVRYNAYAPPEVIAAGRDLTDAQSVNCYISDALLDAQFVAQLMELSHQPVIISEYSFHSLDGRSGNRNTTGFAGQVTDQQARADAYRLFTTRLAEVPWIIGADWFQWADEPPSGRSADGEDVNFGVVDVDDREYPLLAGAIRETSPRLNQLHRASSRKSAASAWRDGFAELPQQHIPELAAPIRINGELSDWPESCRLQRLRLTQTIGMDRSQLAMPQIYVGWRPEGLYLGMAIADDDIVAAPINGRYWTRDMVEFWVATRPVRTEQTGYNQYCHQFMFLPTDPSLGNGIAGTVGQWHRPGDSLRDHLLPHPQVQYNCRILAGRYVVEMFIPASSLHGWDPIAHPQIAFNVHVRNYQHAAAYFWSAPKEVQTQLRPATWGLLKFDPINR